MYTRDEEEKCLAITIINTKKNQCFGSATKKSSKDNNFRSEYERKQMTREQQQRVKEKKKMATEWCNLQKVKRYQCEYYFAK